MQLFLLSWSEEIESGGSGSICYGVFSSYAKADLVRRDILRSWLILSEYIEEGDEIPEHKLSPYKIHEVKLDQQINI